MENEYEIKEVTPRSERCGYGACPAVYEPKSVTPESLRCGVGPCPEVFAGIEEGTYLIIGKKIEPSKVGLERKVGSEEVLISVPKKIIDGIER